MPERSTASESSLRIASNWRVGGNEELYALAIIDTRYGTNPSQPGNRNTLRQFDIIDSTFIENVDRTADGISAPSEFVFRMNPRNMQLEEPAAVVIVPTQGGGQFIEHQGQIYKNVTISGTTGLRPNPGFTPRIFGLDLQPTNNPETGLPVGERTGFDDLLALRNLFRRYWTMKTDGTKAPYTLMVWQNGKEGEFYVVEPMNFQTTRDASSPYTFEYNIQLRTIERLDIKRNIPRDSLVETTGSRQRELRIKEAAQKLRTAFVVVDSIVDAILGYGQRTIRDFFAPQDAIIKGLTQVLRTSTGVLTVGRSTVTGLVQSSLDLRESLRFSGVEFDAYTTLGVMTRKEIAANQAKKTCWTAAQVATEDSLFEEPLQARTGRNQSAYRDPITGEPRSGGDPTNPANAPLQSGTRQAIVQSGETIRSLARRLLGNTNLWKQLVLVNDLRAPYISPAGDGTSVLRPGDTVLYPASPTAAPENAVKSDKLSKTIQKDGLTERLGRDIRISANQELGAVNVFDFEPNAKGDIALIEGVDNMKQAVRIKFSTEPGSLPVHPFFGILAPIGEKIKVRSLIQFQTNAKASLLSDTRIEDIVSFTARAEGNILYVRANLKIRGTDGAVSVSFADRR